jgi:hypothetical protein
MKQYAPGTEPHCGACEEGYIAAQWFLHALGQTSGTPTQQGLVTALNSTNGYTVDGMVGPITEPAFHTIGTLCLSYAEIKNGQWTVLNPGSFPFLCGKRFAG